jgi:hypothetical protein
VRKKTRERKQGGILIFSCGRTEIESEDTKRNECSEHIILSAFLARNEEGNRTRTNHLHFLPLHFTAKRSYFQLKGVKIF